MAFQIKIASVSEIELLSSDLVDIYQRAFRDPPYGKSQSEVDEFARSFPVHAATPGFRLVVAFESQQERAVGFTYGRTATAGQPWHDAVEAGLRSAGLESWLVDAYQVAEMAVVPTAQRHGVGGRMLDRLLDGHPHKRALLTTIAAESAAYRFYLHKGWQLLVNELIVLQYPRTYRIMGLALPVS